MYDARELALALFSLRIASPAIVLLAAFALLFARPPESSFPSEITQVVVVTRTPRRGLILSLFSLVALTYLLDGLAFVISAVITKEWPYMTGIEANAIIGLVAFSGIAALAAYKDIKGVDFSSKKPVRFAIVLSLLMDIVQVVLYGLAIPRDSKH
jgi:hypothetical protein